MNLRILPSSSDLKIIKNYCCVLFTSNEEGDGETGIYKVVDGWRKTLKYKGTAVKDNNYHSIQVSRKGNTVTVLVDEEKLISLTHKELGKAGFVGIGSLNDQAYFDDIIIAKK